MVTRRMTMPARFIFLAALVIFALASIGVIAWTIHTTANAQVAVDWGDKGCKAQAGNCGQSHNEAVDWGNKCAPGGNGCGDASEVAVDWGDKCSPGKDEKCGDVNQIAVDWGNKRKHRG